MKMKETSRVQDKKPIVNNNSSISMNKTAMAIEKITGIDMHDSNGQVRDFYDIMGDIAGMWDKLDKKSKSSVAEAIAGKIIFLPLMVEISCRLEGCIGQLNQKIKVVREPKS